MQIILKCPIWGEKYAKKWKNLGTASFYIIFIREFIIKILKSFLDDTAFKIVIIVFFCIYLFKTDFND